MIGSAGISEFPDIPEGKSLVYYSLPGVEGEIYGICAAYRALRRGESCIFVASSASPAVIKDHFYELGLDIRHFSNRLLFVDAHSPLIGAPTTEKYTISNPESIYEFNATITDLLKKLSSSTVVFGSLSTVMDLCGEKETIEAVRIWNNMAALYRHILVYNFTAWPYSSETLDSIKKDLFNTVIHIGGRSNNITISRCLDTLKFKPISDNCKICFH